MRQKKEEQKNFSVKVKEGYLGCHAYVGSNYKGYKPYAEINKEIKKAFKEKYQNVKISCTGKSFSGGQDCRAVITLNEQEAVETLDKVKEKINKFYDINGYCFQINRYLYNKYEQEAIEYDEAIEKVYNSYIERLKCEWSGRCMNHMDELDQIILKSKTFEMLRDINNMYDSFNYEENNSMVDYFNNMFYKHIELKIC